MSIWAPVVAALGSSLLTGITGFGVIWWQQRKRDAASARSAKGEAYHQMIAHSLSFTIRARTLRDAMRTRSGLGEGLDVVLRIRAPLDPLALHDWFAEGFEPMNQAWSKIEVVGSPAAVRTATKLIDACADIVSTATQSGVARSKFATVVLGLEWTDEQEQALERASRSVLNHRRDFIRIARAELGTPTVDAEFDQAQQPS